MKCLPHFKITRTTNENEPGTYDFQLRRTIDGKLVCGDYRCKSPIPPRYMLARQATLNTTALLDGTL